MNLTGEGPTRDRPVRDDPRGPIPEVSATSASSGSNVSAVLQDVQTADSLVDGLEDERPVLGDTAACASALNAAEQAFARTKADNPARLRYFDEAYMSPKLGHCFRELGNGEVAEHFARRSLDMVDGYTRGRTFNVLLLANAHLQQHDLVRQPPLGL